MLSMFQMLPFLSQYNNTDLSYRDARGTIGLPFSGCSVSSFPTRTDCASPAA